MSLLRPSAAAGTTVLLTNLVFCSIALRAAAMLWSAALGWRLREWRLAFLTLLFGFATARQILTLQSLAAVDPTSAGALIASEMPGLALSVLAVVSVFVVQRLIDDRTRAAERLAKERERTLRLHKAEALSRLAGGVAHDFNNLFAAIQAHAEMAARQLGPRGARVDVDRLHRHLEELVSATTRGQAMVEQVLAVGRTATNGTEPVSLREIVEDVVRTLRPTIRPGVRIYASVDPACEVVDGDRIQIYRAVANLCANAADATASHGSEISVRVRLFTSNGETADAIARGAYAEVCVEDDGRGLPEDIAMRALEPYFTTKHDKPHSGLGLWIVEGIAAAHGGAVRLEPRPERGARARLFLPLGVRAAKLGANHDETRRAAPPAPPTRSPHASVSDQRAV